MWVKNLRIRIKGIKDRIKDRIKNSQVLLKLEQWVIFTVIIALLPIVLNYITLVTTLPSCPPVLQPSASSQESALQTNCAKTPVNFNNLIAGHGEVALICAAITAEAIGDMFMSMNRQTKSVGQLTTFGMCCIIFFLSAGIFIRAVSNDPDIPLLGNYSLWIFLCTLLAGGGCKFYVAKAEAAEKELRNA